MKKTIIGAAVRVILPPLLGAGGAIVATILPAYHAAFCGGSPLSLVVG